nr:MAG TPA: hypothetical protein [Caudoviricetes sp.]
MSHKTTACLIAYFVPLVNANLSSPIPTVPLPLYSAPSSNKPCPYRQFLLVLSREPFRDFKGKPLSPILLRLNDHAP